MTDFGRASTVYVSPYRSERVNRINMIVGESRTVVVNFHGALNRHDGMSSDEALTDAQVSLHPECFGNVSASVSGVLTDRASIDLYAISCGRVELDVSAETDEGRTLLCMISVMVNG